MTQNPISSRAAMLPRRAARLTLALLALPVAIAACNRKAGTDAAQAANGPGPKGLMAAATAVSVSPAITKDITRTLDVTGSLVALQDVVVGAKSAGKVAAVYPHEGDQVSAGQVVALMDTADLQNQVLSQQANLQSAVTREQQANAALLQARNQLTSARNAVTSAETTMTWTDKTTATAVQTAQAGLESAQENLSTVKQGAREQERQQAEESVRSAQANYDKARSDLKRYQALYREQAVSQSQLDQAQATFDSAQASLNSARQALSLIQEGARPQDIRRAELGVQQAREALVKAQSDRAQVALRKEDLRTSRTNVATAQAGVKSAEAGVASSRAGVAQARAALHIAQDNLADASVRAPITGIVAERRVEPGQQVGSGGAIMRIVSPKSVYFQAVLSESQYPEVRVGQTAAVTVDALPGKTWRGSVTRILPVASASARSFTVRIDFPGDSRLRPQMFARGSILIATHRRATLVPKDAVIFDPVNSRTRLFVAATGTAQERTVSTGFSNPQYVEILRGVRPGEPVITAGQTTLQNGDKVRVQ